MRQSRARPPAKSFFSFVRRDTNTVNSNSNSNSNSKQKITSIPHLIRRPYHSSLIKSGSIQLLHHANCLLKFYLEHSDSEGAWKLFDEIPERDVRTWTVLISGLSKCGHHGIALDYFTAMQNEGTVAPNAFTFSAVLKCIASVRYGLPIGKAVHGQILTTGIHVDVALDNAILDFYSKFRVFDCVKRLFELMDSRDSTSWNIVMSAKLSEGKMEEALDFFWRFPNKCVSSWNTIIDGLLQQGLAEKALELLYEMLKSGHDFNGVTFSISLALASSLKNLELGRQIHALLLRTGRNGDSFVSTSLLGMYCKCREMHKASVVFRELQLSYAADPMAQTVSWSTIIAGCAQNGLTVDALRYFRSMLLENMKVDLFTLTTIVNASANYALLELGQQIHAHTLKIGHEQDVFLCASMIDMYAKCGNIHDSWSYFRKARTRNVVPWSAMISSFGKHGMGNEAIRLFEFMRNEGIKPNEVSFLGVLTACSHAGLVEDGCKYFKMMTDVYGIRPAIDHFTCMIDIFGRAGHLREIKDFVYENGIHHLKQVWRTCLSSCWLHKNVEMTNWVSKKLLELDPCERDHYHLVSNTYLANDDWEQAEKLRGQMLENQVRKLPGQSWIS